MTAILIALYKAVIISSRNCMSDMGKELKKKQSDFKAKNAMHWNQTIIFSSRKCLALEQITHI